MDSDDGTKAALRTTNREDILVFRPGQSLQYFVRFGRGKATHDKILWAIQSRDAPERASTMQSRINCVGIGASSPPDPERPGVAASDFISR